MVHLVAFDIDGAERSCRTEVLTLAATYTPLAVHSRHLYLSSVGSGIVHHLYSPRWAMPCTCATAVTVADRDAVVGYPYRVSDMYSSLLLTRDGPDGICRTDLRAVGALRATVSALEGHLGLHQPQQVGRWSQHIVPAGADAQLTRRTMRRKMSQTP